MAFGAGAIVGKMSMDISGYRQGMLQATSIAQIFPATVTNFIASPMLGLIGIAAQAGRALAGVFKDAVGGGVKLAADYEQSTIALGTMLGGAEKAQKLLKEMKDFAAATPFEFPEIVTSARQLVAFGVGGDKVLATLKTIGDVAAGTAVPIKDLAYLFGTIKSSAIANTEDLNQFAQRGIPIFAELAKQIGNNATPATVKKMASESKISFEMIEKAFGTMSGAGGRFFNLMEAQSHSLSGLWSTLHDVWGELTMALGQPVADALKPKLEALTKWVTDNPQLVKAKFAEIGNTIVSALELAGRAVLFAVDHFEAFKNVMIAVASYKGITMALELMGLAYTALTAKIAAATAAQTAFNFAQKGLATAAAGAAAGGAITGDMGGAIGGGLGAIGGGLAGQAIIPIPGVGFLIGAAVGTYAGSQIGSGIQQAASSAPTQQPLTVNVTVKDTDSSQKVAQAVVAAQADVRAAKERAASTNYMIRTQSGLPWGGD